jgi:Flp pilus assembly pilin Flp
MNRLNRVILNMQVRGAILLGEAKGQDLIEYALMAGFVAVAAGAIMPGVASSISRIFSRVASVMTGSSAQGS